MEQDTNLMPHHKEVNSPTSLHPDDEKISNHQGGTKILGGKLEAEMHNISFDESHHRVVQSQRVPTLEEKTSLVQFEEKVIVTAVHKHPVALANATRVYAKATSSSVHFLIAENERMKKELQMTKQGGDLVTMSPRAGLKKAY